MRTQAKRTQIDIRQTPMITLLVLARSTTSAIRLPPRTQKSYNKGIINPLFSTSKTVVSA
jgi:hypothetical protein